MARPHARNRGMVNGGLKAAARKEWEGRRCNECKPYVIQIRKVDVGESQVAVATRGRIANALPQRALKEGKRDPRDILRDVLADEREKTGWKSGNERDRMNLALDAITEALGLKETVAA